MRVAIVNKHVKDGLGGSEIQCDNIARGLNQKDHEVFYLAINGNESEDYNTEYEVIAVSENSSSIVQKVININPDIVYWRYNKKHLYKSVKQIKSKGIKFIFAISHINDTKKWNFKWSNNPKKLIYNLFKMFKGRYEYLGYKYVDAITSLNPQYLESIKASNKIYIPNSITSEKVKFERDKPFVFWVANIKSQKRPEIFIKLAKSITSVDFLMVGDIQQESYEWIQNESDKIPNFFYLGKKSPNEVNGILEKSLFLIHTCKPEGFGNNFIQAWLQAKPTISLEFDPADYIKNKNLGYVCDNDFEMLVKNTQELIDNDELRYSIGKNAYDFSKNMFSIDKTVEKVEKLMLDLVSLSK